MCYVFFPFETNALLWKNRRSTCVVVGWLTWTTYISQIEMTNNEWNEGQGEVFEKPLDRRKRWENRSRTRLLIIFSNHLQDNTALLHLFLVVEFRMCVIVGKRSLSRQKEVVGCWYYRPKERRGLRNRNRSFVFLVCDIFVEMEWEREIKQRNKKDREEKRREWASWCVHPASIQIPERASRCGRCGRELKSCLPLM